MIIRFGEFELDPSLYQIRRAGSALHLPRKAFDVLAYLVEQRRRVVTKQELLDHFWDGRSVTEGTLSQVIKLIRGALGQSAGHERIETIRARGFRFKGEDVSCLGLESGDSMHPQSGVHRIAEWSFDPNRESWGADYQKLLHALDTARGGAGALAVIVGATSALKTGLVVPLSEYARASGINVMFANASKDADALELWLAALALLSGAALRAPVLAVIEDVHGASDEALGILDAATRRLQGRKAVVVMTCCEQLALGRNFLCSIVRGERKDVILIGPAAEEPVLTCDAASGAPVACG